MNRNEITFAERLHRISRATILCRYALNDLCADYLRAIAILYYDELSEEQSEALEDVARFFADTADEVQFAMQHLDAILGRLKKEE